MKTVNEKFTTEEFTQLLISKGPQSWHDFIMKLKINMPKMNEEDLSKMRHIAYSYPNFRRFYRIQIDNKLMGWHEVLLHKEYNLLTFDDAVKSVIQSEIDLVKRFCINDLFLLEDIAINAINPESGMIYEKLMVPPEIFKELTEMKTEEKK